MSEDLHREHHDEESVISPVTRQSQEEIKSNHDDATPKRTQENIALATSELPNIVVTKENEEIFEDGGGTGGIFSTP